MDPITIIIPMAGRGSRFANVGYETPKPLIPFGGRTMIEWVIDNLTSQHPHTFVFICQESHLEKYPNMRTLLSIPKSSQIVTTSGVTEGAACSVLLARDLIDTQNPLLIANSDQIVDVNFDHFLEKCSEGPDGMIMTFQATDPKWSFCELNATGDVIRVVEKVPVSDSATVGIYYFKRGSDFVQCAEDMIADDERVKGEFYVAPAYNRLIRKGGIVRTYSLHDFKGAMYGTGTPEDLQEFVQTEYYLKRARG